MLHRSKKEGLGPAYAAAFDQALADGAEIVIEMDADFSHDPADLPRLVEAIDKVQIWPSDPGMSKGETPRIGP